MNYEDILKQIEGSGTDWSQWDLDTAKAHPEFGASMLSYKQDWGAAKDQAGRDAANAAAEQLRRQYGSYLGGPDGSKYYGLGPAPGSYQSGYMDRLNELMGQLPGYQSSYQGRLDDVLSKMENYGSFDFGPAPTYENRYQQEIDSLLDQVRGYGPFSWSKEEDPSWAAYAKQYRREGDRATQEALARAAAVSGGQVSTAAMTAASQAGDYYAGQLSDKISELYQNAYQRYLSEYQLLADKLGQTQGAEQMDYAKFQDQLGQYNADRAQSYDQWLQGYNMLGQNFDALQGMDQRDYGRLLDQIQLNQGLDETGYSRYLDQIQNNRDQQSLYQQQVDAILQAGGTPSAGLVGQSGYGNEYINALQDFYAKQAAEKTAKKGSGGGGPVATDPFADFPEYDGDRMGLNEATFRAAQKNIVDQMNRSGGRGDVETETLVNSIWDQLSNAQRETLRSILAQYGLNIS